MLSPRPPISAAKRNRPSAPTRARYFTARRALSGWLRSERGPPSAQNIKVFFTLPRLVLCITQALHHAATPLRFTRLSATRGHTSVGRAPSCRRRTRPDPGHSEVLSGKPDTGSQNARRVDPYDEKPT